MDEYIKTLDREMLEKVLKKIAKEYAEYIDICPADINSERAEEICDCQFKHKGKKWTCRVNREHYGKYQAVGICWIRYKVAELREDKF